MAKIRFPSSIVMLAGLLGVLAPRTVVADEPACEREKIHQRAYKNEKSNKPADTAASFEHEIAACKDKLSDRDHLDLLIDVVRTHLKAPPDLESCRRVAERGLRLVEKGGPSQEINRAYGYCGGDCSKAACVPCCDVGVKKRKEDDAKDAEYAKWKRMSDEEKEMQQDVPCDLGKARQMATRLDKGGFGRSALLLIAKYHQTCAVTQNTVDAAAVANDTALIQFHLGDDRSCLKTLDGISDDVAGTAFNRALCGGSCTLDAGKCAKAADARTKALATRASQTSLREQTQVWCSSHPTEGPSLHLWKLPTDPASTAGVRGGSRLIWAGDINGDGLGDLVEEWDDQWQDTSSAALNGYAMPSVRWKAFRVLVGCPRHGFFAELMERNAESETDSAARPVASDDKIAIRMLEQPGSRIRSVCVYPSRKLKCTATKCNRDSDQCADLTQWERAEKSAASK